jgi:hypothetical protein
VQRFEVTFKHWLVFAENVHPLTMIIHLPTVQRMFVEAQGGPEATSIAALRYAIGACAVASLPAEGAQSLFGDNKRASLQYFQAAANQALQASSFLRVPSLELLQAYLLYLVRRHFAEFNLF